MSTQQFDDVTRWAIWMEYGKQCQIGEHPITIDEVVIDHMIPESAPLDARWPHIKSVLGLEDSFIRSTANHRCVCAQCNGQKSNLIYPLELLTILVSRGRTKEPKITKMINDMRDDLNRSGWRAVAKYVSRYGRHAGGVFASAASGDRLPSHLRNIDLSKYIGKNSTKLLDVAVLPLGEALELSHDDDNSLDPYTVYSVRGLLRAREQGYNQPNGDNFGGSVKYAILEAVDKLHDYLGCLRFSPRSTIHDLRVSPIDASRMPSHLFGFFPNFAMLLDCINADAVKIADVWVGGIKLDLSQNDQDEHSGITTATITEVFRGDFDKDGDEEVLVCVEVDSIVEPIRYAVLKYDVTRDNFDELDDANLVHL